MSWRDYVAAQISVGGSMLSETCIQCNCPLDVIAGAERVNGNGIQPAGNLNGPMDTQYRSHYKNAQCMISLSPVRNKHPRFCRRKAE